jgi:hypothetical protein
MPRHIMEPDPDADGPSFVSILWLIVLVLAFVLMLSLAAPPE